MKERPILISGPLIRPTRAGEKTQTRRLVRWAARGRAVVHFVTPSGQRASEGFPGAVPWPFVEVDGSDRPLVCPYGVPGDRLYVRETFAPVDDLRTTDPGTYALGCGAFFAADYPSGLDHADGTPLRWRPSIHMPRALSRIDLEVTAVRVERLQAITEEDAKAEGVKPDTMRGQPMTLVDVFAYLWRQINGERASWASNPWVWVVDFKLLRGGL